MDERLSRLVEALIFAAPEPVDDERLVQLIGTAPAEAVSAAVDALNGEYEREDRSFRIVRGAGGYRFVTLPEYSRWVRRLVVGSGRVRLSRAALETVSLIAYRQPVSRADIEAVRGVDVSGILHMLLERKLVRIVARSQSPGRPLLYGTTPEFLRYFGLNSLDELPRPGELKEIDAGAEMNDRSNSLIT